MQKSYLSPHFLMQLRRYSQMVWTFWGSLWQQLCSRGRRDWMREQEAWSSVSSAWPVSRQFSSDSNRIRSTRLINSSLDSFKTNFSVRFWGRSSVIIVNLNNLFSHRIVSLAQQGRLKTKQRQILIYGT